MQIELLLVAVLGRAEMSAELNFSVQETLQQLLLSERTGHL